MEAPDVGQLVRVRGRLHVVSDVDRSDLPAEVDAPLAAAQHLVSLKSVEDDGLGEELRVVWELEPGARALPAAGLPDPVAFDEPERLRAFLDSVAWGAIASADSRRLQAPFRAGIEIEDYQLEPLVKALEMPRVSLLIADDVGLGKTIEAGMVALELILRHRAQSIMILCPSSLQRQWQDQMRDKFGLEFRIVDRAAIRELRRRRGIHANPWTDFPRLIVSYDYLKRPQQLRTLREVLPAAMESRYPRRFDLMILDEAHNVAPSGSKNQYAVDSQRTEALRTLTPHFEHKLFLTATPHNGYQQSFSALLELLDDQRFARGVPPDRRQVEAVLVRRLKDDIVDGEGRRRFPPRQVVSIEVDYPPEEREIHALLERYAALRRAAVESGSGAARYAHEFALKLLKKRLFSSPAAFLHTLEAHMASLKGENRSLPKPDRVLLQQAAEEIDSEFDSDQERDDQEADALATAGRALPTLTDEQEAVLEKLHALAARAERREDAKARALIDWLAGQVRPNGSWSDRRVILFTEYRDTQRWLQELLAAEGLAGDRLMTLYGGMDTEDRERIKAAFQAHPDQSPVRILLATDAASEGIDLQNHCSRLVHYEIPWNPNRMEQRNGRVDRHGQRADAVEIHHFVGRSAGGAMQPGSFDADHEFIARAVRKVGPVIARQIEEAMLGQRAALDTGLAEEQAKEVRTELPRAIRLRDALSKHREQLDHTREELDLEPARIADVVAVALELAGQPALQPVTLPPGDPGQPTGPAFRVPQLTGDWSASLTGLEHPHTRERRPITFDPDVSRGRDDVVLAHLNHRLVETSLRLLRAEVWADAGRQKLNRATARIVPDADLAKPAVVAHARLVVTGADGDRLHEQLVLAGGFLRDGRFARFPRVGDAQALLDAASDQTPASAVQQRLLGRWPDVQQPVLEALEARKRDLLDGMNRQLADRRDRETAAIASVLEELGRAIDRLIGDAERPQQLNLAGFDEEERDQLDRDLDALRRRRAEIPGEIAAEQAAIARRFERPEAHLFPVALTFLVPASQAGLPR